MAPKCQNKIRRAFSDLFIQLPWQKNIARNTNAVQATLWLSVTIPQCHNFSFSICQEKSTVSLSPLINKTAIHFIQSLNILLLSPKSNVTKKHTINDNISMIIHGYPAYSHHVKFPPWWVFACDDNGGNLSMTTDNIPPLVMIKKSV